MIGVATYSWKIRMQLAAETLRVLSTAFLGSIMVHRFLYTSKERADDERQGGGDRKGEGRRGRGEEGD